MVHADSAHGLQQVLWWRTAKQPPQWPILGRKRVVDVAIIGAGFTGLSAALRLAAAGAKIAVLEACIPGVGASGRCAGFVVPNLARADPLHLQAAYGQERGERLARLIGTGANTVFETAERLGCRTSISRCGWIQPVVGEQALPAARARFEQWQRLGQPVQWLNAAAAQEATGLRGLSAAWLDHSGGTLHPVDYLHALCMAIQQHEHPIYTYSPVTKLESSGQHWLLSTPEGQVQARQVLVCTNGLAVPGLEALKRTVLPIQVYQIATQPLSTVQRAHLSTHAVSDTRQRIFTYRFDADSRLISGGIALVQAGARRRLAHSLLQRLIRELALPNDIKLDTVWSGRMAMTADYLPKLHQPQPGLWVGIGCNGRGIVMSTVLGNIMGELALGHASADSALPITKLDTQAWPRFAAWLVTPALLMGQMRDVLRR